MDEILRSLVVVARAAAAIVAMGSGVAKLTGTFKLLLS
jgi:hypothetical protein